MRDIRLGFELGRVTLALGEILPVRQIKHPHENASKYKQILSSIKEMGLVEPLVVFPEKSGGKYLLLDGHQRFYALRELGRGEAECIIAKDDECFTYNARVSRLAPIQEHRMIVRAVRNGVSPERIAAALSKQVREIKSLMSLLDGIHEEAADALKDKNMSPKAIRVLKKVSGVRQIEIAELMVSANNFTAGYAEALVLSTPKDQLANPSEPKKKEGLSAEEIARMEEEMESLERDLKAIEESYGENMLNLTCARGYVRRLLENGKVVRFLNTNYPDISAEFEEVAATEVI